MDALAVPVSERSPPADLRSALLAGDPAAFSWLYASHAEQVLAWCIRLAGPDLDPEDAAHQVFETAWKVVHRYRGDSSPSTWLYGITRGVLANRRRRAALRRWLGLDEVRALPSVGPEHELLTRRRAVQLALGDLPEAQREVLVLVEMEERSAVEAAAMIGVPVGTVYSRLHAAKRSFARAWAERDLGRALATPESAQEEEAPPLPENVLPLRRRP